MGKETYSEGEVVRLQNIESKEWDDGTILSYDIDIDGTITSRHRKYMCKTKNSNEATE